MKSSERKIIVLSNLKSPNFEQAFFVLKDGRQENRNAVFEAEKIIEEYVFPTMPAEKPRRKKDWDFLPFAITAIMAVLAGVVAIAVNIL